MCVSPTLAIAFNANKLVDVRQHAADLIPQNIALTPFSVSEHPNAFILGLNQPPILRPLDLSPGINIAL